MQLFKFPNIYNQSHSLPYMQLTIAELQKAEQQELQQINKQLQARAQKFSSEYIPLTLSQLKLYKIKKASQTGKIAYLESILLEEIADLQERRKIIKERMEKFFPDVKVQSDQDKFFVKRQEADYSQEIRYNVWYLFGVDYMSNQKIRNYFGEISHFKIQWINDSACNIVFQSKQQAQQAIKPHLKGQQIHDITAPETIWHELHEYQVQGIKRKLFCRLATKKDSKIKGTHGHDSKYYRWEINKKKINNFVKAKATGYINKEKKIRKEYNEKKVGKKEEESDSEEQGQEEQRQGEEEGVMKEENA